MIRKLLDSKLIKTVGLYTTLSGINSAIPFLLLPVLTRYMTAEDYGIVAMFTLLITLITPFTNLSAVTAIPRMYFEESIDIKEYTTNYLLLLIGSTVVVLTAVFLFAGPIAEFSEVPRQVLWMATVVSFGSSIITVVFSILQVKVKPFQYGAFQISLTTLNAGCSIFLVVAMGMAWQGRVDALLITNLFGLTIAVIYLWKNGWIKKKLNLQYIKHAVNFSFPLIPHALGGIVITMTDRALITKFVGLDATGVYTVAFQVATAINLLSESFNKAYVPWLYERLKNNIFSEKIKIVKYIYIYFAITMGIAVVFGLTAPWFLNFFLGKQFTGSGAFVFWISIGFAFQGMYMVVVSFVYYAQKTGHVAGITFFIAASNIVMNYFLILRYGAIGAAYSNTIVNLIKFLLVWILAAKVYDMPWFFRKREA